MKEQRNKSLYRVFCGFALLISVYLIIDYLASGTFEYRAFIMFVLMIILVFWGLYDWRYNYLEYAKKEEELRLYKMYVQPLEGLVSEIRSKQHEFDNHLNAILNMHLTIDNYEDLVKAQSEYILDAARENETRQYISLLKISDKVLAGFLYSKIMRAPEYIKVEVEVRSLQIISAISEHDVISIVGTLVDNAFEACTPEDHVVKIVIDSQDDQLVFQIMNQAKGLSLSQIGRFFEKGYTTKTNGRGLGLYQAKLLAKQYKGEIGVSYEDEWIRFEARV